VGKLLAVQSRHSADGRFPHLLVRIVKKYAKSRFGFVVAQLSEAKCENHPYMRIRVGGERAQHGERPGARLKGDHPGRLRTDSRVRIIDERSSHIVNSAGVRLIGQGLQRREPQVGIDQTGGERVEITRISEETYRPQADHLVTGEGMGSRPTAVGIIFDAGLNFVGQ
jgi:hypothetical protein